MIELEGHNKADDSFNERIIDVLNLGANAHKTFLLSTNEEKRKLIKLVLSTIKLNGRKPEFTLRSPLDALVKTVKTGDWSALVYTHGSNQTIVFLQANITDFIGGIDNNITLHC